MTRSDMKRAQPSSPSSPSAGDAKKPRRSQRLSGRASDAPAPTSSPAPAQPPASSAAPPSPKPSISPSKPEPNAQQPEADGTASPAPPTPAPVDMTPASSPAPRETQDSTQVASQFYYPPPMDDEEAEEGKDSKVWGYLTPLGAGTGKTIRLDKESHCSGQGKDKSPGKNGSKGGCKSKKTTPSGFIIGRHPECDLRHTDSPVISNRHCVIYKEVSGSRPKAVLEDLSSNGTWVNGTIVGRNHRRDLKTGDEIELAGGFQYMFRYPTHMVASKFRDAYGLGQTLGSGHFATVHKAVEKKSGHEYAVKIFKKRGGVNDQTTAASLQQEIAVLMSVAHPNILCLKDTYDEEDGVYLVLELASEGELFNYIIQKQKLSEDETRKIYRQLLEGLKYLHDRNIVHRDIKPENILLCDKNLTCKLADFGLSKIIGEDSFTTSLCGTPSYVAPEMLANSRARQYTRAVDMWSLGVVLYICLCGFPPFSDELYTPENPYNLSDQIKMARFDFPSPYWDSVGDPALDLIERMLDVVPERRITVDEALRHPWIVGSDAPTAAGDSFASLTGGFENLGFQRRKVHHERTLLCEAPELINTSTLARIPGVEKLRIVAGKRGVREKAKKQQQQAKADKADKAADGVEPGTKAFMNLGKKDGTLYDTSGYTDGDAPGEEDEGADEEADAEPAVPEPEKAAAKSA